VNECKYLEFDQCGVKLKDFTPAYDIGTGTGTDASVVEISKRQKN